MDTAVTFGIQSTHGNKPSLQLPSSRKNKHSEAQSEQSPIKLKLNTALRSYRKHDGLGTAAIDGYLVFEPG